MRQRFRKAVSVWVVAPCVIDLSFGDGHRREVEIEPRSWVKVFAPLHDAARFRQAAVDLDGGSVSCPTGADLAPEFLSCGKETLYGRLEIARTEGIALATPDAR